MVEAAVGVEPVERRGHRVGRGVPLLHRVAEVVGQLVVPDARLDRDVVREGLAGEILGPTLDVGGVAPIVGHLAVPVERQVAAVGGGEGAATAQPAGVGLLPAEQAEQHLGVGAFVLGVQLEAVALEILDGVGLAVGRRDLDELLGERVAVDRQPAVALPVGAEHPAEAVPGLREVGAQDRIVWRHSAEGRLATHRKCRPSGKKVG